MSRTAYRVAAVLAAVALTTVVATIVTVGGTGVIAAVGAYAYKHISSPSRRAHDPADLRQCSPKHAFSPALIGNSDPHYVVQTRDVCGGAILGNDIALETVLEHLHKVGGDGRSSADDIRVTRTYLLSATNHTWSRTLLYEGDFDEQGPAANHVSLTRNGNLLTIELGSYAHVVVQLAPGQKPRILAPDGGSAR
jgi:hypothetical protein